MRDSLSRSLRRSTAGLRCPRRRRESLHCPVALWRIRRSAATRDRLGGRSSRHGRNRVAALELRPGESPSLCACETCSFAPSRSPADIVLFAERHTHARHHAERRPIATTRCGSASSAPAPSAIITTCRASGSIRGPSWWPPATPSAALLEQRKADWGIDKVHDRPRGDLRRSRGRRA